MIERDAAHPSLGDIFLLITAIWNRIHWGIKVAVAGSALGLFIGMHINASVQADNERKAILQEQFPLGSTCTMFGESVGIIDYYFYNGEVVIMHKGGQQSYVDPRVLRDCHD